MGTLSRILLFHEAARSSCESVYFLTRWLVDGSEKANGSWKQWNCDGNEILPTYRHCSRSSFKLDPKKKKNICLKIYDKTWIKSEWIVETCVSRSFIYLFLEISRRDWRNKKRKKKGRIERKKSKDKKERRHKHDFQTRCPTRSTTVITVVVQFTRVAGVQGLCTYGRYTLGAL